MKTSYKVLFVGIGSIGKKHIRNLVSVLGEKDIGYQIDAVRSSIGELPPEVKAFVTDVYYDIAAVPSDYDIAFITNPTFKHYDTLLKLKEKAKNFFVEKPIFAITEQSVDTLGIPSEKNVYVACPLRYKECLQYVKQEIDKGLKVISARAISSSYLPEWRKGVDYRDVYSAKREMGGGVTLDLIHEWDYLTYFWGFPEKIWNINGKYSNLEIDSDDLSVYIAKYPDKLVEVHLDYFGRKTERRLELFLDDSRMDVDIVNNSITIYENGTDRVLTFETKDFYVTEMEYFLDCVEGRAINNNSINHAYDVLKMVYTK